MNTIKIIVFVVVALLILMQFIPQDRTNPDISLDLVAPEHVKVILRNSCYDCHSNETVWPWYSKIFPVSFLIAGHVNEGREHLNFSHWDKVNAGDSLVIAEEIFEVIEENEMPLPFYVTLHPEAEINKEKHQQLMDWLESLSPYIGD